MTSLAAFSELTHPLDILRFAVEGQPNNDGIALVFITATVGGAVRMPGLRMAVRSDGATVGYVSNGCVEADIIKNALAALADGKPRNLAYGQGSPLIDLRLPCGGRLDLMIVPRFEPNVINASIAALAARRAANINLTPDGRLGLADGQHATGARAPDAFRFAVIPKIRLRIVGMGAEAVTLARLALASDMDVLLQSPDRATVDAVARYGGDARLLSGLGMTGDECDRDDPWTACAVLFHDHEWETKLLPAMLCGEAFYVGVLGSFKTHQVRCLALSAMGVPQNQIDRMCAPIGIIPRLRDSSLLAISVLGEIAQCFQETHGSF